MKALIPAVTRVPTAYGSNDHDQGDDPKITPSTVNYPSRINVSPDPDRPIALGDCRHWWQPIPPGMAVDEVWLATLRERFPADNGTRIYWYCQVCGPTVVTLLTNWTAVQV